MKILMVCLGNICRSPLAEGILKQKALNAGLNWHIESAGTNNMMGYPPHRFSKKVAQLNGINIDDHLSRGFTAEDFDHFDKIYAMSTDVIAEMKFIGRKRYDENKVSLLMDEIYPGDHVEIPDPWYGTEPDFHNVFELIDSACEKLVDKYSADKKI